MEITVNRKNRRDKEGLSLGIFLPEEREVPLVPFGRGPAVICEVKKGSPSRGVIKEDFDPVAMASHYVKSGVKHISVLTEEDYFYGSLKYMMDIKRSFPEVTVLRKDFLVDVADVETSYRAGADAFLLIASLLEKDVLYAMYNRGIELGMTPLVELHDKEDADKVRELQPFLTGINSRNLKNFTIDPMRPLKIRSYIDWPCQVIYESGITSVSDGEFARDSGFAGVLVGEWAVRKEGLARDLVELFMAEKRNSPWEALYSRYSEKKPFVKICGIAREEDARLAHSLGADLLGFVLAPSPRQVNPSFVRSLKDLDILKVGVVVVKEGESLDNEVLELIEEGALDFIQFHGDESRVFCDSFCVPYYKALRVRDFDSLKSCSKYPGPVLIDAYNPHIYGGTGHTVDKELVLEARKGANLWLAGGLKPENVYDLLVSYRPDMIDASSGLEKEPGVKDSDKMKEYFTEIERYGKV